MNGDTLSGRAIPTMRSPGRVHSNLRVKDWPSVQTNHGTFLIHMGIFVIFNSGKKYAFNHRARCHLGAPSCAATRLILYAVFWPCRFNQFIRHFFIIMIKCRPQKFTTQGDMDDYDPFTQGAANRGFCFSRHRHFKPCRLRLLTNCCDNFNGLPIAQTWSRAARATHLPLTPTQTSLPMRV